jgi:aspartate/methionine/tyrosine aminotransferase
MLNSRLEGLREVPFQRLAALIGATPMRSNLPPIDLSVGEPRRPPPALIAELIDARRETWNRYPPVNGTVEFRAVCAKWLTRRYALPAGMIDPETMIAPCAGTREGLYMAATVAVPPRNGAAPPVAMMPNPFYQVYIGASVLAGADPIFLPTAKETGFLPDLEALDPALLDRAALFYLCSPANPQGAVASLDYWKRAITLARQHDFLLVADECYAEIYSTDVPPAGALEAAVALGGSLDNLLAFHTLSKRSSVPGLRSGFSVGSPQAINLMRRLRTYSCAATPLATLEAATALWGDEEHVVTTRNEYREKFDVAEKLLAGRFGFYRPAGGFYLWLDVGDGEEATRKLWSEAGVKVLPGAYLTRHDGPGPNPNQAYIRVALVEDVERTEEALTRFVNVLR